MKCPCNLLHTAKKYISRELSHCICKRMYGYSSTVIMSQQRLSALMINHISISDFIIIALLISSIDLFMFYNTLPIFPLKLPFLFDENAMIMLKRYSGSK